MGNLDGDNDEYLEWERLSKLVLPPKIVDGRVQIGGKDIVGFNAADSEDEEAASDSDVLTVGESDSEDSSDDSDKE
jgi:hypothetical protein